MNKIRTCIIRPFPAYPIPGEAYLFAAAPVMYFSAICISNSAHCCKIVAARLFSDHGEKPKETNPAVYGKGKSKRGFA